ncbi:hemerythrin domain-containing protein [Aneurinibacillus danicus]|uniref:Hemerythrin-like domain-containing protein n=1 Tax=Aneurinibacillus danicus TaxID=267746 RepID=A0A511VC66_9BACL|nr:hemerythrin domain-containing protein [Aneurinibacillus danicus]GEN35528.1 hypothetical protein ADA01nite_29880 [Aneurinibacillus danicus]
MFSEPHTSPCHNMSSPPASYSPAIQQLLDEHEPLRQQMRELIKEAGQLLNSDAPAQDPEILQALLTLFMKEQKFKLQLELHSEKEENGLFTLLKKEMGDNFGPVQVMEYEHEEAKRQLAVFEELSSSPSADAKEAATHLMDACQILLLHFTKEENVLFPFAENALTPQQKQQLFCSFHQ